MLGLVRQPSATSRIGAWDWARTRVFGSATRSRREAAAAISPSITASTRAWSSCMMRLSSKIGRQRLRSDLVRRDLEANLAQDAGGALAVLLTAGVGDGSISRVGFQHDAD